MIIKTFIIESQSNYGLVIHIVNTQTNNEALKIAREKGACHILSVVEIDTKTKGLVYEAFS